MRRSLLLLHSRPGAAVGAFSPSAAFHLSSSFRVAAESSPRSSHRSPVAPSCAVRVLDSARSARLAAVRSPAAAIPFHRVLSTSLPSSGAPASPSASTSNPSFSGAQSATHTGGHTQPQQPAVGAHPPHSSVPSAPSAPSASVTAAGSGDVRLTPSALPVQADAAPPANESRLRRLFRQYGVVAVGSYLVIYVSTLGMLYVAIKERWLGGYDIQHVVDALGLASYFEHIDPRKGDFAVAWLATKFTEPVRLAITAAITPTVARLLGMAPPKEKGVRADVEARVKDSVEQAKDKVEERLKERSAKQEHSGNSKNE